MIHASDPECFEAFERLLAQPDPPEVPRRTHIHSCDGEAGAARYGDLRLLRPTGND